MAAAVGCSSTSSGKSDEASAMGWMPGANSSRSAATTSISPEDPTSLAHKLPTPGADLFVATAHMYESTNSFEDAAAQYERALKVDSGYLPALLGYAQLHDAREEYAASDKLYQTALKKHPKDASIYNDWGMSYERRGKLPEAVVTVAKAVDMEPKKPLYRNNLAMMLVELNKPEDAFRQLVAVNSPAVAHYNLASLLHRKGNDALAAQHFALAAADPALPQARQWAMRLAANTGTSLPALPSVPQPPAMPASAPIAAHFESQQPAPAEDRVLLASRPAIVVERVASLPANEPAGRDVPPVAPSPIPAVDVHYPQPAATVVTPEGDVPPAPNQMRALPPVINALPPLY
jgi:Flp pilus assembly protein TadD